MDTSKNVNFEEKLVYIYLLKAKEYCHHARQYLEWAT